MFQHHQLFQWLALFQLVFLQYSWLVGWQTEQTAKTSSCFPFPATMATLSTVRMRGPPFHNRKLSWPAISKPDLEMFISSSNVDKKKYIHILRHGNWEAFIPKNPLQSRIYDTLIDPPDSKYYHLFCVFNTVWKRFSIEYSKRLSILQGKTSTEKVSLTFRGGCLCPNYLAILSPTFHFSTTFHC